MLTKLNQYVMIVALLQDKVFCIAAMQLVAFVASAGARVMRTNLIVSRSSQHNRIDVRAVVGPAAMGLLRWLKNFSVSAEVQGGDVLDRSDAGRGGGRYLGRHSIPSNGAIFSRTSSSTLVGTTPISVTFRSGHDRLRK